SVYVQTADARTAHRLSGFNYLLTSSFCHAKLPASRRSPRRDLGRASILANPMNSSTAGITGLSMNNRNAIWAGLAALVCCLVMVADSKAQSVNVWLTTDNQKTKLRQQQSISFSAGSNSGANTIFVDEPQTFQTIEGFGASFTDSAAFLLSQKLQPSQLDTV